MQKFQNYFWVLLITLVTFSACKITDGPDDLISLAKLNGTWIRVESNNPSSDFMKIEAAGGTGIIIDKAGSGFSDGDIKWQGITPVDLTSFAYQELGSDYNYYDATITMVNDNELRINVGNSGAGNSQKWLRDDGTIVNNNPTILDCNYFTEDRVLLNTTSAIDYVVTCVMDITASVTIEPGVVIAFEENAGFGVYDAGSLNAVGTSAEPIVFRGETHNTGFWRGVHVETNSSKNRFEFVTVEDAGSNYVYCCNEKASLFIKDGQMTIQNSTFRNGANFGILAKAAASLPNFQNNTITTHGDYPMNLAITRAGDLDGTGSDYTGNSKDFIYISGSTVDDITEISATNVPFLLDGEVFDIKEPLTLKAGVELAFEENGGLGVYDGGSLKLEGSASNQVILRGKEANKGYWRGIHIETNSSGNNFSYVRISDAGADYVYCCNEIASVFLKGGTLAMSNTTISNGDSYGFYADKNASIASFSNNTITTHAKTPLYLAAERAGELTGTGSDFTGNDDDYAQIYNSGIALPTDWPRLNVPYLVATNAVLDVTSPFGIEEGTEVVFGENAGIGVYDNGTLNAVGTASNKIIFRGKENVKGYWRGIHTETNSNSNEITHAEIANAGSNYVYCCNDIAGLIVKDGKMKVTNSYIHDNDGCGIFVKSGATLEESGNTFANNTDGNICN